MAGETEGDGSMNHVEMMRLAERSTQSNVDIADRKVGAVIALAEGGAIAPAIQRHGMTQMTIMLNQS